MNGMDKREAVMACLDSTIHNAEWANKTYTACDVEFLKLVLDILKAQVPVEPAAMSEDEWACGNCYSSVVGTEDLDASGFVPVKFRFCPNCGMAVKWE